MRVRAVHPLDATPTGAEALTTDQLREPLTKLRVSETCAESDQVDPIIRRGDAYTAPQVAVPGGAIGAPGRPRASRARCGCCDVGGRPGATLVAPRILASCAERYRVW